MQFDDGREQEKRKGLKITIDRLFTHIFIFICYNQKRKLLFDLFDPSCLAIVNGKNIFIRFNWILHAASANLFDFHYFPLINSSKWNVYKLCQIQI